jgi:hypothetical protein
MLSKKSESRETVHGAAALVAHRRLNVVVALAVMTIRRSKSLMSGTVSTRR